MKKHSISNIENAFLRRAMVLTMFPLAFLILVIFAICYVVRDTTVELYYSVAENTRQMGRFFTVSLCYAWVGQKKWNAPSAIDPAYTTGVKAGAKNQ